MRNRLLLAAAAFIATSLTTFANLAWDFSTARAQNGAIEVPDSSGNFTLAFATGASVGEDGGARVLVLDGSQKGPGITTRATASFPDVQINLRFKGTGRGGDRQTLLRWGVAYELRYLAQRGALEFIVYYPPNKFTSVQVNAPAGQWHDARATFVGDKLALQVGKNVKETRLPAGSMPEVKGTLVRVGHQGDRLFVGALAALSINAP
jgi:predicted small integral membrane protein